MKLKQSKVFKAGIGYTIGNVMVKGCLLYTSDAADEL